MLVDIAARIVLAPVLLVQALLVRRNIVKLPEPQGARHGVTGNGPPLRLLVLGDSSAAGVGADHQDHALLGQVLAGLIEDHTVSYDLVAVSGARTKDALDWMQARGAQDYDVVLCALGVNDVTHGATPAGFVATLSELLDHLQTQRHAKHVVLTHLPPMGQFSALPQPLRWVVGRQARRLDRAMQELVARRMGCIMLDHDLSIGRSAMASDGFHPGPLVYASWGQRAAQVIAAGVRPS